MKDWNLAPYVVDHDDVLVTHNSKDFRGKTAGPGMKPGHLTKDMHPGLVCLNRDAPGDMTPSLQEEWRNPSSSWRWTRRALNASVCCLQRAPKWMRVGMLGKPHRCG